MKYVISYVGAIQTVEGETLDTIADDCRDAGLAFVNGVARRWTKRDLALWLDGPYRHATRHATGGERTADLEAVDEEELLGEDRIYQLMGRSRAQVMAFLEAAALPEGRADFVEAAVKAGHIVPRTDDDGISVWVPVDARRMRLRDRVRSLFAVDYLLRPEHYAHQLTVCHQCELVLFDELAKRFGNCGGPRRISGIVASDGDEGEGNQGSGATGAG